MAVIPVGSDSWLDAPELTGFGDTGEFAANDFGPVDYSDPEMVNEPGWTADQADAAPNTVWWKFIPTESGLYKADSAGTYTMDPDWGYGEPYLVSTNMNIWLDDPTEEFLVYSAYSGRNWAATNKDELFYDGASCIWYAEAGLTYYIQLCNYDEAPDTIYKFRFSRMTAVPHEIRQPFVGPFVGLPHPYYGGPPSPNPTVVGGDTALSDRDPSTYVEWASATAATFFALEFPGLTGHPEWPPADPLTVAYPGIPDLVGVSFSFEAKMKALQPSPNRGVGLFYGYSGDAYAFSFSTPLYPSLDYSTQAGQIHVEEIVGQSARFSDVEKWLTSGDHRVWDKEYELWWNGDYRPTTPFYGAQYRAQWQGTQGFPEGDPRNDEWSVWSSGFDLSEGFRVGFEMRNVRLEWVDAVIRWYELAEEPIIEGSLDAVKVADGRRFFG